MDLVPGGVIADHISLERSAEMYLLRLGLAELSNSCGAQA